LIGKMLLDGRVEIRKRGRPVATIKHGEVYCAACGRAVGVQAPDG
jgi:hypothetical protein